MRVRAIEMEIEQKRNTEMYSNERNAAMDTAKEYYQINGRKGIRKHLREKHKILNRKTLTEIISYWDEYFIVK